LLLRAVRPGAAALPADCGPGCDFPIEQFAPQLFRQRRAVRDIEAQVNGSRHLVHVLPARTLRTHCRHVDFRHRDVQRCCDLKYVQGISGEVALNM
jgi:hypothetical protein